MNDEDTSKTNINKNPARPVIAVILLNILPLSIIMQNNMHVSSPTKNPGNVPGVWLAPLANKASPAARIEDLIFSEVASPYFLDSSSKANELLSAMKIA